VQGQSGKQVFSDESSRLDQECVVLSRGAIEW
jgi:hypothetical protein